MSLQSIVAPIGVSDAFGRLRVAQPTTLFDSKQIHDNQPLFWDDAEVSGGSTTSSYSANGASTTIGVAATTSGKRVRQTFQRWNYQPGKSQLYVMTGVMAKTGGGAGITRGWGFGDDQNGFFFQEKDGVLQLVRRSYISGTAVDTEIAQSNWNVDKLDGTGDSLVTVDASKSLIFFALQEWLGVGSVWLGFFINGSAVVAHRFDHANLISGVYTSTPNVPLRYYIENDGTGAASTLEHICSTVITEGGVQDNGILRYVSTAGTHIDLAAANTLYPVIGIRLKSAELDGVVSLVDMSMINQASQDWEWSLILNPTLSSALTFADQANSSVQTAIGDGTASVASGGTLITGGYVTSGARGASTTAQLQNALRLGAKIDGTRDEIYLCARPLAINADIEAGLTWRELS